MDDWMYGEQFEARGPWARPWHGLWGPPWGGPMYGRGFRFGPRRGPMPPWARFARWSEAQGPWGPRGWYPEMGRRFPFGGGPGPRMFERGYLKYALLDLLQEGPKHGYEMMKDLEQRMGGFYAPSAGAIYPTLQLLEDRGWAKSETVEGKKVYTITDEGRGALAEAAERRGPRPDGGPDFGPGFGPKFGPHGGPWHEHESHGHHHEHPDGPPPPPRGPHGPWEWGERGRGRGFGPGFDWRAQPEAFELARQARELGRLFLIAGRESINRPERIARLREIVERTRAELEAFARETQSGSASSGTSEGPTEGPAGEAGSRGPVEQL